VAIKPRLIRNGLIFLYPLWQASLYIPIYYFKKLAKFSEFLGLAFEKEQLGPDDISEII